MDSNLNNILVHPHVLRKGETVKMLEAKHLTSAMAAWEICLCQRPRVQNYFKNSFHCWMTWCMLNEIFASRNYATWKPGDWHRNIRNYTLKKHQHRELAMHTTSLNSQTSVAGAPPVQGFAKRLCLLQPQPHTSASHGDYPGVGLVRVAVRSETASTPAWTALPIINLTGQNGKKLSSVSPWHLKSFPILHASPKQVLGRFSRCPHVFLSSRSTTED